MAKRLTSIHPTSAKVREVEDLMHKLHLAFSYEYGSLRIQDSEKNIIVKYVEQDGGEAATEFPCMFETKLIILDSDSE